MFDVRNRFLCPVWIIGTWNVINIRVFDLDWNRDFHTIQMVMGLCDGYVFFSSIKKTIVILSIIIFTVDNNYFGGFFDLLLDK